MHVIVIALLGLLLVAMLWLTVTCPKPAQRAIALFASLCTITLTSYMVILLMQMKSEVWNYGRNIRATGDLFAILGDELRAAQYDQAALRLELIQTRWDQVNARPDGYSATDILEEIRISESEENTDSNVSEQAGAAQPATRVKSDTEGSDKPQPQSEGRSR